MKPGTPLPVEYLELYQTLRADVQARRPFGMLYHLGYLRAQQANFILHGRWKAWVDLYTLTKLEELGILIAT